MDEMSDTGILDEEAVVKEAANEVDNAADLTGVENSADIGESTSVNAQVSRIFYRALPRFFQLISISWLLAASISFYVKEHRLRLSQRSAPLIFIKSNRSKLQYFTNKPHHFPAEPEKSR
jgi:hypothetical protein